MYANRRSRATPGSSTATRLSSTRTLGTFIAEVSDARQLDFADNSFDVALRFGPLYHLREKADRLTALREAARVVTPRQLLVAGFRPGISTPRQSFRKSSTPSASPTSNSTRSKARRVRRWSSCRPMTNYSKRPSPWYAVLVTWPEFAR
ncbi:methyltransferase domain-containing protein [Kribbella sp. CA-293567]|uniref:methyltransferase domain-containing protein n=1 Tax=Kribbella sp. CA-293567 TaxID=3002436 RepID=UPI0022DCEA66|nr:methyltransferase domain-containing protein [Kribbella sp. CA-293567]WBQ07476.1 methyltransferase domain-containing protein [Kribbella sp. CA-293567]